MEQDARSFTSSSCTNQITVLQTSPAVEVQTRSRRRNSLGGLKSASSCNNQHGLNDGDSMTASSSSCNHSNINMVVPLTDSHTANHHHPKGTVLSRLFPRLQKKKKPNVETLRMELVEARKSRDTALAEVAEIKSSFGDLKKKLESLEGYCEELKKALQLAVVQGNTTPTGMPVSDDVMVEGFLQMVSESRLSVKHLCKMLIGQVDEQLTTNLNSLLNPYGLSLSSKHSNSKAVLYHLEAMINGVLYQEFENCVFQKNGAPKLLDPQQERQAQFAAFVGLRNLSWNQVIRKGTKYYSHDFSCFCDHKMSCIIAALSWTRPWPEHLLQSFFVAAKCVWLLHLLAFSFHPPLAILRVDDNRPFDPRYMEDLVVDRQRPHQGAALVKLMAMPGFYVQDKILKCKVVCTPNSTT